MHCHTFFRGQCVLQIFVFFQQKKLHNRAYLHSYPSAKGLPLFAAKARFADMLFSFCYSVSGAHSSASGGISGCFQRRFHMPVK